MSNGILSTVIMVICYLVLAPFVGGLLAGLDRKFSARLQGRVGPPVLQPFYDVLKLREKEAITVNKVQDFYVLCFFLCMLLTGAFFFGGADLLLALFTLTLAGVFLVLAAYSSGSPYAQIGAERELLSMMAYEPMVLFSAIGFYLFAGSFSVSEILHTPGIAPIAYLPLVFLGFLYILPMKLRKSPFDLSTSHHAHQELVKGLSTEFSGSTLALMEVAHWYENVFLLGFIALFFAGSHWWTVLIAVIIAIVCYFLEVLVDNSAARMKWQFALKSAWFLALILGFVNLVVLYYL
jgi:formate hydrogenlyase subunit 4